MLSSFQTWRGGAQRVCIDLSNYFVQSGYVVDLVLRDLRGSLLKQIPRDVNLIVTGRERRKLSRDSLVCSISEEEIHWVIPKELINHSNFRQFIIPNWPYEFKRTPKRNHRLVDSAHGFSEYLKIYCPNIVLANLGEAVFYSLIGREISGNSVPVICSVHASQFHAYYLDQLIHSALLKRADWIHTVSKGLQNELSKLKWVNENKVTTIYNSVDFRRILLLQKQLTGHPWIDKKVKFGHKVVLAVARFHEIKNHQLLLRSFAAVSFSGKIKLIILGEGTRRPLLQSLTTQLGLNEVVSMPGWVDNPYSFMFRSDVFVLSSNSEGFPVVLIEALACGCNIVSTDCSTGPSELLNKGQFGKLVPVDDERAMAQAISNTLQLEPNRETSKVRALEFSLDRQMAEFERMIGQVIDSANNF